MMSYWRNLWKNPKVKGAVGVLLILVGLTAFFTPLTPGSWLALIGLELLGLRVLFYNKLEKLWRRIWHQERLD